MGSDLFPGVLETDRLRLRPLDRDAVDVLTYYDVVSNDPGIEEVTAYVPWEPHDHPKETLAYLRRVGEQRADGENAEWLVQPEGADDAAFAGVVGLSPEWERRTGDLGVWLRRRFWGEGYAGEALAALLPVAFERLDLDLAVARVRPGNERSTGAFDSFVERHGGRVVGPVRNGWLDQDGTVHDVLRYEVSREEWRQSR